MRHSKSPHRPAYLPSLLDRLQDDAPHKKSEHPNAYAPSDSDMRRLIQRDLALLLNTTNLDGTLDPARFPSAAASVINYGVPPLAGDYLSNKNWASIEKLVRTAIIHFEPRLIPESVNIRPLSDINAARYNKLIFEISGLVQWSPYPLEFRIQSTLDLEMDKVQIGTNTHAGN